MAPENGQLHMSSEWTGGLTDEVRFGAVALTAFVPGLGWQYAGFRVLPHFYAPKSWGLPLNLGFVAEFSFERRLLTKTLAWWNYAESSKGTSDACRWMETSSLIGRFTDQVLSSGGASSRPPGWDGNNGRRSLPASSTILGLDRSATLRQSQIKPT